jgi:hypothetical protein
MGLSLATRVGGQRQFARPVSFTPTFRNASDRVKARTGRVGSGIRGGS